jgi:maleate cis-trans isomerase
MPIVRRLRSSGANRALEAACLDADGYFISCANISVLGVVQELEARLDRPVVTSNPLS